MSDSPASVHVLTWNLNGLESTYAPRGSNWRRLGIDTRTEKICMELILGMSLRDAMQGKPSRPVPDVLCFQEVVARSHTGQLRHHLAAGGFQLIPHEPPDREDYVAIAVRAPFEVVKVRQTPLYKTALGRELLEVEILSPGGHRINVMTGHFDSLRSGADARIAQTRDIARIFRKSEIPCVFAGDTNLRDREWELCPDSDMVDAWAECGNADNAETWWPEMEARGFRFDRIWASSGGRVRHFSRRRKIHLSDHAAIEASIVFET